MKCVVLAAGYATRLYPLTENFPKPLLEVRGKTILDWLLDDVDTCGIISEYIIISNHKFATYFNKWSASKKLSAPITVIDDGTQTNETRLGAVRDILLAIEQCKIAEDIMVLAGDNLLDFSLCQLVNFYKNKGCTAIMRYFETSEKKLQKCGVVSIDADCLVKSMEEKPDIPQDNWCVPPFYIYKKDDLTLFKEAIDSGCDADAPGSFVAWVCGKRNVFSMEMPGKRYDIGDLASYEDVKKTYTGIKG